MASEAAEPTTMALIEGWRMAMLLLAFATVTFILEKTMHFLEHAVKHRRGLAVALDHIKNELLCVGSISLLLSAFQNLLAKICIPLSKVSLYTDRRRLLAGGSTDYCGPDKQSLWPVSLQHDTHIFIFVVACTHIVYGTLTVYLTIWRVRSWAAWERQCQVQGCTEGDLKVMKMPAKFLYYNVGSNPVTHFFLMLFRQYQMSVTQSLYSNARLLFIEKWAQEYDFNFHEVVIKGLETELMTTLHPEWHLWLIAVVWYAIPPPAYVSFWMYGISVLVIVLVGGKLVDILVQLSVQVAIKYGDSVVFGRMDSNPRAHTPQLIRTSMRASAAAAAAPVVGPDIQKRFHVGNLMADWLGPWAGGGGSYRNHEGTVAAPTAPAAALAAGGTVSAAPAAGQVLSNALSMLPSRDHVVRMLRTMASEIAGSGSPRSPGGEAAAIEGKETPPPPPAPLQEQQHQPPEVQPSSARLPGSESLPDAESLTAAAAAAAGPSPPPATSGEGGDASAAAAAMGSSPSRRLALARGSAPAAVRRLHQHHSLRYQFLDHTSGADGAGGAAAAAATLHQAPAIRGGGGADVGVGQRHLSVITESRAGSLLAAARGGSLHRHPQGLLAGHPHHRHRHVTLPPGKLALPHPQPEPTAKHSVFELFQRRPTERQRAMPGLWRAFAVLGGGAHDGGAITNDSGVDAGAASPTPSTPRSPVRQHGASLQGRSRRTSRQSLLAMGGSGGGSADGAAAVVPEGDASGAAGKGSVGGGSGGTEIMEGSGELSHAATAAAVAVVVAPGERYAARGGSVVAAGGGYGGYGCGYGWRRGWGLVRLQRTASGRRKVPLVMRPFYCGAKYVHGSKEYVEELLEQRKAAGVQNLDAKEFFWFRRPRFMTALFTLAYFQNSLSIAVCIFSLAGKQDSVSTWQGLPTWTIILQLMLDVLLVPQVSLAVLPFYALIQPLGSHCPQDLLEMARQDRKPRIAQHRKIAQKFNTRMADLSHHIRAIGKSVTTFPAEGEAASGAPASSSTPTRRERSLLASLSALLLPGRGPRKTPPATSSRATNTAATATASKTSNGDVRGGRWPTRREEDSEPEPSPAGAGAGPGQRVGDEAVAAALAARAQSSPRGSLRGGARSSSQSCSTVRGGSGTLPQAESASRTGRALSEAPSDGRVRGPVVSRVPASLGRDPLTAPLEQWQQQHSVASGSDPLSAAAPAAAGAVNGAADRSTSGGAQPPQPRDGPEIQLQVVVDSQC